MKEGNGKVFRGIGAISLEFLNQLYKNYDYGILELKENNPNPYCSNAIVVYPLAVATWEAFFSEAIFNEANFITHPNSKINSIPVRLMERWDLHTKNVTILDLLYGKTFDESKKPYQDFTQLVSIRNELVHFKVNEPKEKFRKIIFDLSNRGVFHSIDSYESLSRTLNWEDLISTLEGIRWAINTIVEMVHVLYNLIPENDVTHMKIKRVVEKFTIIDKIKP